MIVDTSLYQITPAIDPRYLEYEMSRIVKTPKKKTRLTKSKNRKRGFNRGGRPSFADDYTALDMGFHYAPPELVIAYQNSIAHARAETRQREAEKAANKAAEREEERKRHNAWMERLKAEQEAREEAERLAENERVIQSWTSTRKLELDLD